MKLEPTIPKKRSVWAALRGGIKMALAVVLLWIGLNSFLIGIAYDFQPGAFLPRIVGGLLIILGLPLLVRGTAQVRRNVRPTPGEMGLVQ